MDHDRQSTVSGEEAKLREFLVLQKKWMGFASEIATIGVGIAYCSFRPLIGTWPTLLTYIVPSYEASRIVFLGAFACMAVAILTAFAVNSYRDRLGALKNSARTPVTKFRPGKLLKWVLVVVASNELIGMVLLLFE